jgi:hypothetical protein
MLTGAGTSRPPQTSRRRWTSDHWRFLALLLVPALVIALARRHGLPTSGVLARHASLLTAPRPLQHTLMDILLVPIGALVVVVFRLTLGIHVLGPFRSILLAFAFLTTGITVGLIFLGVTVVILVLARPAIRALKLPYFGRVSVMISLVALVMVIGTLAAGWLQSPSLRNVAHFPIVVLVLVGEKVAVTIKREGARTGIWRAVTTALIGVIVTAIASIPGLERLLLAHPELLLVEISLIAVVSTLCPWRLLDGLNPRPRKAVPAQRRHPGPRFSELAGAPRP